MIATVVTCILVGFVYFLFFYKDRWVKEQIDKIPGPKTLPLIGNVHQLRFGHEKYKRIKSLSERFGQFGVHKMKFLQFPVVFIYRAQWVELLLSSTKHIDKSDDYKYLHPWLGTGLLTSTGDKWRVRRKQLTPTFHFNILNDFLSVFNKQADILVNKLQGKANKGNFNIFQDIALCALDIICETAMGTTVEAQKTDSDYVHAVYRMSTLSDERMRKPLYWNNFLYNTFGDGQEYARNLKVLHDFTKSVISDRLKDFDQKKSDLVGLELSGGSAKSAKKVRLAFLDMLLYMSDNLTQLTLSDIQEEVDTFMFEGHDTTAAAMNWAIHLIGANSDVQAKVHEEMDRVFGDDNERDITIEDLKDLKYLENCIKEALRLFPSVPIFARRIGENLHLGELTVPQGTTVVVLTTALHRDPEVFPDPELYNPDRFSLENSKGRNPYSYVPFSAGPRNCIGQKFAMMEEKVVLAQFFRRFKVTSFQTREDLKPVGDLILRPESGISIEIKERH